MLFRPFSWVLGALFLLPAAASAEPEVSFGKQGMLVIGVDAELFSDFAVEAPGLSNAAGVFNFSAPITLSWSSTNSSDVTYNSTAGLSGTSVSSQIQANTYPSNTFTLGVAPSVDYFVTDNVSLGGQAGFLIVTGGGYGGQAVGIAPRLGRNFRVNSWVSIWPKVSLPVAIGNVSAPDLKLSVSVTTISVDLFVPVLFHLAPHFFVGIGPRIATDLTSSYSSGGGSTTGTQVTTYGLATTLGGWL